MASALYSLHHRAAERSWRIRNPDARLTHRFHLGGRGAATAGNDRTGMTHTASGRGRHPGDEADSGLLTLGMFQQVGALFLGGAADFADHDDALSLVVAQKH